MPCPASERVANNLLKMAEKMPEELYGFQAVPEIRARSRHDRHTPADNPPLIRPCSARATMMATRRTSARKLLGLC